MQSVCPAATVSPISTNGGAPGCGRAVEGADHRRLDADRRRRSRAGRAAARPRARRRERRRGGDSARASSVRRTETRIPDSSIVTSPTPDSWTMRTTSRISSARCWSTRPPTSESWPPRAPADRRAAAAPPRRRRARAAAAPPRSRRGPRPPRAASSRSIGASSGGAARRRASTRAADGRVDRRPAGRRSGPRAGRGARRRRSSSAAPRGRGAAPASRGSARSARRAAASRPPRGSASSSSSTSSSRSPARVRAQLRVERGDEPRGHVVLGRADGDRAARAGSPARRRSARSTSSEASQSASTSTPASRPSPASVAGERLARHAVERRARAGRPRRRRGRRPRGRPRARRRARCRPSPGSRCPTGSPVALRERADELLRRGAGSSAPDGSCSSTREAPSSGAACRLLDQRSRPRRCGRGRRRGRRRTRGRRRRSPRLPRARFETSLSGSWSRKTSMPFSAAVATKRRTKSPPTGREPTRKRPRSASASGVSTARLERADPLPRALDAAAHRRVEDAPARDLEVGEAGAVEDLRERDELGGRHPARERLLPEQADRRVDELRHRSRSLAPQVAARHRAQRPPGVPRSPLARAYPRGLCRVCAGSVPTSSRSRARFVSGPTGRRSRRARQPAPAGSPAGSRPLTALGRPVAADPASARGRRRAPAQPHAAAAARTGSAARAAPRRRPPVVDQRVDGERAPEPSTSPRSACRGGRSRRPTAVRGRARSSSTAVAGLDRARAREIRR